MDSFSEDVLERARQRTRRLQAVGGKFQTTIAQSAIGDTSTSSKFNLKSKTKISTVVPGSPKGHMKIKHNVLNFQQEHFDMEIKLASMDKCLVQVEIQEQSSDNDDDDDNDSAVPADLREESKCRLRRLGKLYSEDTEGELSSPIRNRTEEKASETGLPSTNDSKISQKARSKLAALAQNIQQWENESPLPLPRKPAAKSATTPTKSKYLESTCERNIRQIPTPSTSQHQPFSSIVHQKNEQQNTLDLNDSIVNALEIQGYTREDLKEKKKLLTYKFNKDTKRTAKDKNNAEQGKVTVCKTRVPVNRLIENEKLTPRGRPSIHSSNQPVRDNKDPSSLSLHERKAIFERNADKTPLLPKAAFALNCPKVTLSNEPPTKPHRSNNAGKMENDQNLWNIAVHERDKFAKLHGQGIVSHRLNALMNVKEDNATISQQQIEAKIREEKERDMDLLLNRFHTPLYNQNFTEDPIEDDREIVSSVMKPQKRRQSSEESNKSLNNSRTSVLDLSGCSAQVQFVLGDVREVRVRRNSRTDHTRLYPVLSDIETATETENEAEEARRYDEEGGHCAAADGNMSEEADDSYLFESSYQSSAADADTSTDMCEYEDDCGGPTPPKCGKVHFKSPVKHSAESPAKSQPKLDRNIESDKAFTPTHVIDGDTIIPLQHTVSFYRKQQQQLSTHKGTAVPLDRKQQQAALDSILDDDDDDDDFELDTSNHTEHLDRKLAQLRLDVQTQERTIAQASRALTLCNARPEFSNGSTEQVEAERLLLIATHRRQAALYEIGRVQVAAAAAAAAAVTTEPGEVGSVRGDLVIGRLTLPLKREYVRALGAAGGSGHHVVCLLKCDDAKQQVVGSRLVSTAASSATNTIDCVVEVAQPAAAALSVQSVCAHSTVTVEVYCLQAHDQHLPHHVKYHIRQPAMGTGRVDTPRKLQLPALLRGRDAAADCESNRMIRVPAESPGGPNTVRTSSFALMGYAIFTVRSLLENNNKKQFTLSATPQMSPLEGSVEVGGVRCTWEMPPVQRRGFLTMYEDVTGFGAWHRRWFKLDGSNLRLCYWKYPDDEFEKEGRVIELRGFQPNVGVVPRDVCARLHTILLQHRDADRGGKYLLSADTKEERIAWCDDLNRVLKATVATQYM